MRPKPEPNEEPPMDAPPGRQTRESLIRIFCRTNFLSLTLTRTVIHQREHCDER